MSYKILYTKSAYKDIKKLDSVTKKRIKKGIEKYISAPVINARKLTNPRIGSYRWRVGNYRIVFDIDDRTIVVLRIRHRKESYR
ncbi:MAG: addiction module antitoxin [Microgenomates group bacterium GW2011_GWC1_37_8]|uniref:Addiction module toxin, RelE/StbE family n=1 Tax=Candidatus Woesebacteria bacterium GW2011_GWB1_38_8 TaxID=1618570 RepID=A0A0G0PAF9_9BACT|nr:MAG: addiction module antitoxin [Microgenomates group bacterium GW2011_GWC1_37_8]KKQ86296.1 MAG: Addiction module toxin, RelE/StbE family [Candidatus Woesebacteria bacterium GW2011_GWB1_38_8]